MATKEEIQSQIDSLDAKLASGVSDFTNGPIRTTMDLKTMQAERARLQRKLAAMRRRTCGGLARPIHGLGDF